MSLISEMAKTITKASDGLAGFQEELNKAF
jgi:hypothetical protein